jgi:DNA processing protein
MNKTTSTEELFYQLALTKISGIGPVSARQLVSYCGGVKNIFEEKKTTLAKIPGIGLERADFIKSYAFDTKLEKEIKFIEKNQIQALFYLDPDYPFRLKHLPNSPLLLFYKGTSKLNEERTVAIVGTRSPTENGKLITEKLVEELKVLGVTVISGLAFGIDSTAHRKSVEFDIPNIAVLGHGLDRIYPFENQPLANKIMSNGGLLTEFPSGTKPDKENFPMRNRIIAGLADAVVVIESKARGGSIITAELANEYNKDVFAVPGKPNDEYSKGCNKLIKSNKAHLLESIEDLIYITRWELTATRKTVQLPLFVDLTDEESQIIEIINEASEITIDDLCYRLNKTSSMVSPLLLNLEFNGLIRSLPGKRYMPARR